MRNTLTGLRTQKGTVCVVNPYQYGPAVVVAVVVAVEVVET